MYFLSLSMYLQLNRLLFFFSLLQQNFDSCPIPIPREAEKRVYFLNSNTSEPKEPDCQYYRKERLSIHLDSDWSRNQNYTAYEKSSKQSQAMRVTTCAEISGQDSNPTTGRNPPRTLKIHNNTREKIFALLLSAIICLRECRGSKRPTGIDNSCSAVVREGRLDA